MTKLRNIFILLSLWMALVVYPNDLYRNFSHAYQEKNYKEALSLIPQIEQSNRVKRYEKVEFLIKCIDIYEYFGEFNKALKTQFELKPYISSPSSLYNLNINITDNFCRLGQYEHALILLDSLEMSPARISRQAYIYFHQDKIDNALDLFSNLLASQALTHRDRAAIIHNLGFLSIEKHDWQNAIKYITESIPSLDKLDKSEAETNLAFAFANVGDGNRAITLINSALKWQKLNLPNNHPELLRTLLKKAQILFLLGDYSSSSKTFHDYYSSKKEALLKALADMSYEERMAYWNSEKFELSKCFILENISPEFLFNVALFRRQTSLLGIHGIDQLRNVLSIESKDIKSSLPSNGAAVEFIRYRNSNSGDVYAAIIMPKKGNAKFVKLFDEDFIYQPEVVGTNSLINAIKRDDPMEKNLLYTDSVLANKIWGPIIAELPNNTSKLYFAPEGILHFLGIENMPFKENGNIELHRVSSTANIAYTLNGTPQTERTLLIGGLNYSYLPQDSVANDFSHDAADLLSQKVGNTNIFQYLPGTRSEVDSIHAIISNADITYHIGEANLKQEFHKFDIIHIATHGYSLNLGIRKRPEFSADSLAYDISLNATGLALSGANIASLYSNREDGILSAREICELDLSNVDFVVLSACQTAQGDITDEGAAGLVRGLKNAGVKTVLATLWSVDDKSTMLFMQEFYRLLNDGKTKHQAYIEAQKFLKSYSRSVPSWRFSPKTLSKEREPQYITTKYDTPYYWAPFIIIDDI